MMAQFSQFIQKFFIFIFSAIIAIIALYVFNVSPSLQAQTNKSVSATTNSAINSNSNSSTKGSESKATSNSTPNLKSSQSSSAKTDGPRDFIPEELTQQPAQPQSIESSTKSVTNSSNKESKSGSVTNMPSAVNSNAVMNSVPSLNLPSASSATKSENLPLPNKTGNPNSILYKYVKSYVGDPSVTEDDPFKKPEYLLEAEERDNAPKVVFENKKIDDQMEAIRRWPLKDYRLVGVIWGVQTPKAMIIDPANTLHLLRKNFRIGDRDGVISTINEGYITVVQDGVPVVVSITRR